MGNNLNHQKVNNLQVDPSSNINNSLGKLKLNQENETSLKNKDRKNRFDSPGKFNKIIQIDKYYSINEENIFKFFWKSNQDPWDINKEQKWSPYDLEDQYNLNKFYKIYLADKTKKTVDLKCCRNKYIDFSLMLQVNNLNPDKIRPIQRCHPKLISNKFLDRPSPLNTLNLENINSTKKNYINIINQKTLNDENESKSYFNNLNSFNLKKLNRIYFNVFPESKVELEIEEKLSPFEDNFQIDLSLNEIKSILIQELIEIDPNESFHDQKRYYIEEIEKIENYESFYSRIIYIYTMEGYLYIFLNRSLRLYEKSNLDRIKIYYISLMSSIKYFSKNTTNYSKDLIVYRASKITEDEFKEYQNNNFKNIVRIFYEYLSTSINLEVSLQYIHKDYSEIKEVLWQIFIPKEIFKDNQNCFADISHLSEYPNDREVLLRSGSIIQIEKIIPYTETKGNQIIQYPNKYKMYCTLKSFDLSLYLNITLFNSSMTFLNLSKNDLGYNPKSIFLIAETLKKSNIGALSLAGNKLGENHINLIYIADWLKVNNSVHTLDLSDNNIGYNENIIKLAESFDYNQSLEKIDLRSNNLGGNLNYSNLLKEGLQFIKTLERVDLRWNIFEENEKKLFKQLENDDTKILIN